MRHLFSFSFYLALCLYGDGCFRLYFYNDAFVHYFDYLQLARGIVAVVGVANMLSIQLLGYS